MDEDSYEVSRGGVWVKLTATEFELLRFLMRNPRRVLSSSDPRPRVELRLRRARASSALSLPAQEVDTLGPPMIHRAGLRVCAG